MADRRHPSRIRFATAAMAFCAACTVVLTVAVLYHPEPFAVDEWWAQAIAAVRGDALTFIAARLLYPLGVVPLSVAIVAALALLLLRTRGRGPALAFVLAEGASVAIVTVLKASTDRPRPPDEMIQAVTAAFPSGHTAFATVTSVLLVGLLASSRHQVNWTLLAAAFALAMAWSRTYLSAHWLTDVAGGLTAGATVGLSALVCFALLRRRTASARASGVPVD